MIFHLSSMTILFSQYLNTTEELQSPWPVQTVSEFAGRPAKVFARKVTSCSDLRLGAQAQTVSNNFPKVSGCLLLKFTSLRCSYCRFFR